ncbi:hypothetical protein MO973_10285 [Paenibacillus sp. TRM 82003]|nr:hypothetical protein [Paenibacillus sp. TRM 82003]
MRTQQSHAGSVLADERGAVGIRQIAITVAVIVVIGAAVTLIQDTFLDVWIREIWTLFMTQIRGLIT